MITKYENFKYLFLGRLISNCGDSIYMLVLSWYVFEVTHNTMYVGFLNFLLFVPNFFSFLFGPIIDKHNKRKILLLLELLQLMSVAVIMIGMSLQGQLGNAALIVIFIGAFFAATAGSNTYTVQDAFIPSVVDKHDLPKAEIYMSVAYNGADYVFTAITGFLVTLMSYINLLFIDLITFCLSIVSFYKIKDPANDNTHVKNTDEKIAVEQEKKKLFDGFKAIYKNKLILLLCCGSSLANFMFGGLNVYVLVIAKSIGGASFYGLLTAFYSAGVMLGSTFIASLFLKMFTTGKTLCLAYLLFGLSLMPVVFISSKYLMLGIWLFSFIFLGVSQVIQKPILQNETPNKNMGQVLSAYSTISVSTLSLGSLFWGYIAKFVNWHMFILLFATVFIIIACTYSLNHTLKRYTL
ncbi:MFS transporter [Weissella minor]|uniref:Major facilitator family protein n=1 Tax=Weissella minor TaxID=1620 RepID=A0A0R2JI73_9LACO|nr:MFS transporter [Weissella minor]KRN76987.1 major facilitator family protein [Weissella minor]